MRKRKSESKFQYAMRLLEARQEKLQAEIGRLEAEGYTVSEAVKRQAQNLKAGIRSERQARQALALHTVSRVRNNAYKEYVFARQDIVGTTKAEVPKVITESAEPVKIKMPYRKGVPSIIDKAKQLIKDLRYQFRMHPSTESADNIKNLIRGLEMKTGIKLLKRPEGKTSAWNARHMNATMASISPEKLSEALENIEAQEPGTTQAIATNIYSKGRATPEGYEALSKVAKTLAYENFKENNKLTDEEAMKIYDMFENSKQWQEFRAAHKGQYSVEEMKVFANANDKIDYDKLDTALTTGSDFKEVIKQYND